MTEQKISQEFRLKKMKQEMIPFKKLNKMI